MSVCNKNTFPPKRSKCVKVFMPWLAEFAVPNGTFVEQKVNFLYTFMDHENKHDFHFVV